MTNAEMWSFIAGFLLPPVEAFIQQTRWSLQIRAVVNFLVCCVVAIGVVAVTKPTLTWHNWVTSALTVLVTAIAVYKGLWKPTTVAPLIESKTNVGGNPPPPPPVTTA